MRVECQTCGHRAELQAASDVWKCNCAAGVGPDDCACDALNEQPGTEDLSVDTSAAEIAELEARLVTLRGGTTPEGDNE